MFEELNYIEMSGRQYPLKCDLVVLEKIQEKYGNIEEFENRIMTWKPVSKPDEKGMVRAVEKFPDIQAVNDALFWMVCEGEEILADKEKRTPEKISRTDTARKADMTLEELADRLHGEFLNCFKRKKQMTTQNMKETENAG